VIQEERLIDQVRDVIGADAMAALLAKLGGRRLVIPKKMGEHHPIADAIGHEAALRLAEELAGATLDVPVTAMKRAQIAEALAQNMKPDEIVRRYLCSRRFVFKVQAELRSDSLVPPKQGTLL